MTIENVIFYNGTANELSINSDTIKADIKIYKGSSTTPSVYFHADTGVVDIGNTNCSFASIGTIYYNKLIFNGSVVSPPSLKNVVLDIQSPPVGEE